MVSPYLVASVVSIIPAMGALWWLLKRYEGYFQDAKVFFALTVGLFAGVVAAFFEIVLFRFQFPGAQETLPMGGVLLWAVVGYALFETGIKAMVLGMGRFRARKDAPYYGAPLGFAMGAMMSVQHIGTHLRLGEEIGTPYTFWSFLAMALVPVGAILVHGAVGVWVGRGAAQGSLGKGWAIGMMLQMPVLAALWLAWQDMGRGNVVAVGPAFIAVTYGVGLLWITRKRVLDNIVPKEIAEQVRREQRRAKRQGARLAAAGAGGAVGGAAVALHADSEE